MVNFGGTHLLKQHVKEKLLNKKNVWNLALVHLPQSPRKMLLSTIAIVCTVLLCDQSICATKTLWKDDRCPCYWGFCFFNNWFFSSICCCIKTFHSTCGAQWSPDFNLLVSQYNENLACKTPLKPTRRKCHVYIISKHFWGSEGLKKRDFNLTCICFSLSSPPPIHWPAIPTYCFHSQKSLQPRLVGASDHCSVGEVREWTGVKTMLTYFVFREKVVLVEQSGDILLVLLNLWRKK